VLRTTSTVYTLTGKPLTTTDANGNVTRYAYDLDDRLTNVTDSVGRVTTFGYDALSRPASVSNAAIQSQPLVQRAYTADGLTASLTIAQSNTTFNTTNLAYDGLDRLSRIDAETNGL
jgi:RHS repeat-associated protein